MALHHSARRRDSPSGRPPLSRVRQIAVAGGVVGGGGGCSRVNDRHKRGLIAPCICRVRPVLVRLTAWRPLDPFVGLCGFRVCTIPTPDGPLQLICRGDAIVSGPEESAEDTFQPPAAQECTFQKRADGTLAGFPAPPVASRFSCCNFWWLRFCPHSASETSNTLRL